MWFGWMSVKIQFTLDMNDDDDDVYDNDVISKIV